MTLSVRSSAPSAGRRPARRTRESWCRAGYRYGRGAGPVRHGQLRRDGIICERLHQCPACRCIVIVIGRDREDAVALSVAFLVELLSIFRKFVSLPKDARMLV
jgi:hypothetical protein